MDAYEKFPKMSAMYSRTVFEMLLKIMHYNAFQRYPTNGESFATKMIKKLKEKGKIKWAGRAFKINQKLNKFSHHNSSDEEDNVLPILKLLSEFASAECRIELRHPSPEEESFLLELEAMGKKPIEGGKYSDNPETCPHCNNYIGYISHPRWNTREVMEWLQENDRNYCPFCLRDEWLPSQINNLEDSEEDESWSEHLRISLEETIRQEGRTVYIAKFMSWRFESIQNIYPGTLILKPLEEIENIGIDEDESQLSWSEFSHSQEESLANIVLDVFMAVERNYLSPYILQEILLSTQQADSELYDFEWGISPEDFDPEVVAMKIPRRYRSILNMRLVPYSYEEYDLQVFPNYMFRGEEDIDFSIIHHNGVYGILRDVFIHYGGVDLELTQRQIYNGLSRLDCDTAWEVAWSGNDSDSSKFQLECIPDYCKKWLNYRIEDDENGETVWFSLKEDVDLKKY